MNRLRFFILIFALISGIAHGQVAREAKPLSGNFYERLGVSSLASSDDIKKSFKKLAMKYHPDRHPELDRQLFQNINEAWQTLQDQNKRAHYDRVAGKVYEAKPVNPEPARAAESSAPPGWMEHVNVFWAQDQSYEKNLFRNLAGVRPQARAYLYGLINELDWRQGSLAPQYFRSIAETFVRGFTQLNINEMSAADFNHAQRKVDTLLSLPQASLFPELVDLLLKSPRADYAVGMLFTQNHWRLRPEMGRWLNEALQSKSPLVTMVLVERFLPTLNTDAHKKLFLQKIIKNASDESLDVLAKRFPISAAGPDYREELELLLSRRNQLGARIFRELRSLNAAEMCMGIF